MSAAEKSRQIKILGIIAGGGSLPGRLLQACDDLGIDVFLVGFEGQTDPEIRRDRNHLWTRIGAAGQIIDTLKAHEVRDLVIIGGIRRPSLAELRPDIRTAGFFAKIGLQALGDDGLLKALRNELEFDGFVLHGIQEFASDIVAGEGAIGSRRPGKGDMADIRRGMEILDAMGSLDVGQAVIVQEGIVLGVEAIEGTDELIKRCAGLRRKGRGGVLVKFAKPGQDEQLDIPTIGTKTVLMCAESGLAGIAIQAGKTLMVDPEEVASEADRLKIFVTGVRVGS